MDTPKVYNYKVYDYGSEIQVRVYQKPIYVTSIKKEKKKESAIKSEDVRATIEDMELGFSKGEYDISDIMTYVEGYNFYNNRSAVVSANRAKNKVYEYTRANEWEWFVTLTFNPEKIDSTDYELLSKKVSQWLNNIKKQHAPDLKYMLVPELHDSNDSVVYCNSCNTGYKKINKKCHECGSADYRNAYHFHALMSNIGDMKLIDSGKRLKSGKIYNLGNYKLGFTTATKIHDSKKASNYISKYITKTLCETIVGKKRYWASNNLKKPVITQFMLSEDEMKKLLVPLESQVVKKSVVSVDLPEYKNNITYYEIRL